MKIQLLKVAKFYSRLYAGGHKLAPHHKNVCKFSQLYGELNLRSLIRRSTFKFWFFYSLMC